MISLNKYLEIIGGLLLILGIISCSVKSKQLDVIYLLPKEFEGAVIVIYDQKDGVVPNSNDKEVVLTVPTDGVIKVNASRKDLDAFPKFYYVDDNGNKNEIEFLYRRKNEAVGENRTQEDISIEEKENKVFAMNYDIHNFNRNSGQVFIRSFLISKVKNGNIIASRDLPDKIFNVRKTLLP